MELPPLSLTRSVVYYQDFYCSEFLNTTTGRMQLCGASPSKSVGPYQYKHSHHLLNCARLTNCRAEAIYGAYAAPGTTANTHC